VSAAISGDEGAIGAGDIKLLIPAGIALGLRRCVFATFIAVVSGGFAGIILLASGIKKKKDPIPFGPFIVIGIFAAIFINIY
jgi:prepilin signal peptidase PulO-like enzyme (type II secretory pathway)